MGDEKKISRLLPWLMRREIILAWHNLSGLFEICPGMEEAGGGGGGEGTRRARKWRKLPRIFDGNSPLVI